MQQFHLVALFKLIMTLTSYKAYSCMYLLHPFRSSLANFGITAVFDKEKKGRFLPFN